jgi:hypothetical protein
MIAPQMGKSEVRQPAECYPIIGILFLPLRESPEGGEIR